MAQSLTQALGKLVKGEPARIAKLAKEGHARILAQHKPSNWVRRVDGAKDAPEETVRPDGTIIYNYSYLQPIVDYAMETLQTLSPVESGEHRSSHSLYVGGATASDVEQAVPGEEVYISNPLPYARKIEMGRMVMSLPGTDHVYEQAARAVKGRFGNQASIKFTFVGTGDDRRPALTIRPLG